MQDIKKSELTIQLDTLKDRTEYLDLVLTQIGIAELVILSIKEIEKITTRAILTARTNQIMEDKKISPAEAMEIAVKEINEIEDTKERGKNGNIH